MSELEAVDPRADAREFARLYKLADRQAVRDVLLSCASGALVAAKVIEGELEPDPLFWPCECNPKNECKRTCEAMRGSA